MKVSIVVSSWAALESAHVSLRSGAVACHSLLGLQNHASSGEQLMQPLTSEFSSISLEV